MRVAIAGAGAVGRSIARELITNGHQVLLIDKAAEPGEWAVSGAFEFWNTDAAAFEGKARSAFFMTEPADEGGAGAPDGTPAPAGQGGGALSQAQQRNPRC